MSGDLPSRNDARLAVNELVAPTKPLTAEDSKIYLGVLRLVAEAYVNGDLEPGASVSVADYLTEEVSS